MVFCQKIVLVHILKLITIIIDKITLDKKDIIVVE